MHLPPSARVAVSLLLLVTGCPKSPPTTSPSGVDPADAARIGKLARILRAADRRIVDDDLRALLGDEDPTARATAALALGQIADPSTLPDLEKSAADSNVEARAKIGRAHV